MRDFDSHYCQGSMKVVMLQWRVFYPNQYPLFTFIWHTILLVRKHSCQLLGKHSCVNMKVLSANILWCFTFEVNIFWKQQQYPPWLCSYFWIRMFVSEKGIFLSSLVNSFECDRLKCHCIQRTTVYVDIWSSLKIWLLFFKLF